MTTGDDTIVRRYADALQRRGSQVVLRQISYINGATPNPPILSAPVLDGAVLAGASQIAIRADAADGRLVAGDMLAIDGQRPIAVTADVSARDLGADPANPIIPGFDLVSLASPLGAPAADGAVIVPAWAADQTVWIVESSFSLRHTNEQILAGDLSITLAAFGVDRPNLIDQLLIEGFTRSIINVARSVVRGQTVAWSIQAR